LVGAVEEGVRKQRSALIRFSTNGEGNGKGTAGFADRGEKYGKGQGPDRHRDIGTLGASFILRKGRLLGSHGKVGRVRLKNSVSSENEVAASGRTPAPQRKGKGKK